jgi:hypothetical protein
MSFLARFRAWRTARRQRKLEEYVEKTAGTRRLVYEEGTPPSGGYGER